MWKIPRLVHHVLEKFAREHHKGHLRIAEETLEYLVFQAWPATCGSS
jgi:DNA-binding NtrC family response regulator